MNTFTLVRPEHLNHHGHLFGGSMLKWVDEYAWLVAARDFTGCTLVTKGLENIVFSRQVVSGSILRFSILPVSQGNTSVTYSVDVFADRPGGTHEEQVFSTRITFVRVDEDGNKTPLPKKETYKSTKTP